MDFDINYKPIVVEDLEEWEIDKLMRVLKKSSLYKCLTPYISALKNNLHNFYSVQYKLRPVRVYNDLFSNKYNDTEYKLEVKVHFKKARFHHPVFKVYILNYCEIRDSFGNYGLFKKIGEFIEKEYEDIETFNRALRLYKRSEILSNIKETKNNKKNLYGIY